MTTLRHVEHSSSEGVVRMVGSPALHGVRRYLTVGVAAVAVSVAPWLSHASFAANSGSVETAEPAEYLALGDSVSYGYDPRITTNPGEASYIGYPTEVGAARHSTVVNASCPGDTSAGVASANGVDAGCRELGVKYHVLHVNYTGTQLDFAVDFLRSHPTTNLVTIGIGGNDYWYCVNHSSDHCKGELAATLNAYRANLGTILERIRTVYRGPLVTVNYVALNYSEPIDTQAIARLNAETARVAPQYGAIVADAFGAFAVKAAGFGGDSCRADLLIRIKDGCDDHLTAAGRSLVAATILKVLE
jgi:lysophospholipase L1-like esterase